MRSDPLIRAATARVTELEDRETTLLSTLGPKHPDVIAVQQQLAAARQRLAQEMGSLEEGADSEYQLAVNEESAAQVQHGPDPEGTRRRGERVLGLLPRAQEVRGRAGAPSNHLFQRQANVSTTIVDAQVVQSARPSPVPVSPQRERNFLYAFIGGLIGGLLLAWMAERFDDSVQSPEDVKEGLGLPFLGNHSAHPKTSPGVSGSRHLRLEEWSGGQPAGGPNQPDLRLGRVPAEGSRFHQRVARRGKVHGRGGTRDSLRPEQGARSPHRRRPATTVRASAPERAPESWPFRTTLREGPVNLVARSGPVRGLDVIPAGTPQNLSAERLGSDAMKTLIDQARSRYDWVIIDSPPALGLSDASVIATLADGIVVVCSGDKTPRQAVRHVADQLRAVRAAVLGVVLEPGRPASALVLLRSLLLALLRRRGRRRQRSTATRFGRARRLSPRVGKPGRPHAQTLGGSCIENTRGGVEHRL